MSAPVARTTGPGGGAVQATRQQLDELDALLQRMLDLPVSQAEPESPEPEPAPRAARPALPEQAARPARPRQPAARAASRPAPAQRAAPPAVSRPAYPASYMVVETVAPEAFQDPPPPPKAAPEDGLTPRLLGQAAAPTPPLEEPVPGGRHDLVEGHPDQGPGPQEPSGPEGESGDWVPLRSSWQPSAQTWKPLRETWEQARGVPAGTDPPPGWTPGLPGLPPIGPQAPAGPAVQPAPPRQEGQRGEAGPR